MGRMTIENRFGIPVNVCCASCRNKKFKNDKYRACKLTGKEQSPNNKCASWRMDEKLDNAGRGGGSIKKREYFKFFIDNAFIGDIDDIRREFTNKHGSIYAVK